MDRLDAMAAFVKVVDTQGFSAAARALGVSKSLVSKYVASLEDRLGARLLNRTTRRLSLTDAGAAYYERCLRVLAETEEADRVVGRLQGEARGVLRINAPMSFGVLHLASALPDFARRHPELTVDLTLNDRLVDLVDEGYDVAVRIAPLADSRLVARRLAPSRRVVCGAPDYFARHGEPRHPGDLARHNCLIYTYAAVEDWRLVGPKGAVSVRVNGRLRANNGEALLAALRAGLGVAMLPTFIVGPDLAAGRLRAVLTDWVDDAASVYAVYPHRRHLSTKVRLFVDFLAERFGPRPYWEPPDLVTAPRATTP